MQIKNQYTEKINKRFNYKGNKMNNAPGYIKEIVAQLEKAKGWDEMFKILDDAVAKTSDFICLNNTRFVGNGYKFQCTLKKYVEDIDPKTFNQQSEWELVKIIPIQESDNAVILTKVK